jgi:oligoribonuclease NrnB/cAMP/cGMP phosphodiesterase (DHH superfamily)
MKTIIGSLPKNKIVIKKAVVDSDLDGIVCASLLKSIFGDIEVLLIEPKAIQQGLIDKEVDEYTAIADVGFVEGCGLYFDHHTHNKPTKEIVGLWEDAPSAAGIIYEAYKTKIDLSKYEELVDFVNRFDSGLITKGEVESPNYLLDLAFSITRKDKVFGEIVMEELWKMENLEEFKNVKIIFDRIQDFQRLKADYLEYLKTNVEIIDNVAFVDNRKFGSDITHAFIVNSVYPNTDVVVMIKGDNKFPNKINLSLSRNNFNLEVREHNLLPIAHDLNPKISG